MIASALRGEHHLRSGPFAILRAIGVAQHVKLFDRVHAQELSADPAGGHIVLGCAGKLHAIQQKDILLRPVTRDCKVVGVGRVGDTSAAYLGGGIVDHARIQGEQQIEAAAVQRKVLDLLTSH